MLNRVLRKANYFVFCSIVLMLAAGWTAAQEANVARIAKPSQMVTAAATGDRIRISAPNAVVQLRLEVYDQGGRKVFDTEQRGGSVLDWHLNGGEGERVPDGTYACVVTIKSLSGRLSQKVGQITVSAPQASIIPLELAKLTDAQAQAVGPIEADSTLSVMTPERQEAAVVLAHNGIDGQVARTRGALSFRVGDFFSGNDEEQMRLTEEGNLGIGTDKPQAKLDVAGDIRASGMISATKGIEFADGTVQTTGLSGRKDASGNLSLNASSTGTQNTIAKWTDNNGTLGDSNIFEDGSGNVGIGTTTPQAGLDYRGSAAFFTRDIGVNNPGVPQSVLQLGVTNIGSRNFGIGPSFLFFADNTAGAKSFLGRLSGAWENPTAGAETGSIRFQVRANSGDTTASTERMRITASGNVGIGTAEPNVLTELSQSNNQTTIGGATAALRITNTGNLFNNTAELQFGGQANKMGAAIAYIHTQGNNNTQGDIAFATRNASTNPFLTERMRVVSTGNVGIGTTSPQARLDVRGDVKLGTSGQLFAPGGEENLRIVRGVIDANGNIIVGAGFTATFNSAECAGCYTITFNTPFASAPAVTAIIEAQTIGTLRMIGTRGVTANTAKFVGRCDCVGGETNFPTAFHFIAIGPR